MGLRDTPNSVIVSCHYFNFRSKLLVFKMQQTLSYAASRLFELDSGERKYSATNFKLFPGSAREVVVGNLLEEVNRGLTQIENGDSRKVTFRRLQS